MSRQVVHTLSFERPDLAARREPVVAPPLAKVLEDIGNPIGRVIGGKYVVDASLGEGASGKVYRARHITLDKEVAIKVLHRSLGRQPAIVERFHREARAASKLDHPCSVRVLDFGQEPDGLLYLVMDYIPGVDLQAALRGPRFDEKRIAIVLGQVLAALAVAHDRGIIHRDLKPENILLVPGVSDDGEPIDVVKVCDFGLATLAKLERQKYSPLTEHGMVVGTPEYMSPEQARGDELDARSDLYAIGAILYEMLAGRPPFVSSSPVEVAVKHLQEPVVPPSQRAEGVDPELERICLRALAKDREGRYGDARKMRADLRAIMTARGSKLPSVRPSAESEPTPFALVRPEQRSVLKKYAVLTALLCVAAASFGAALGARRNEPLTPTGAAARSTIEYLVKHSNPPK